MAETLVKKNANLNDTINLIVTVVNQCYNSEFTKLLASSLNPEGDKLQFMHRLFDYVCRNVEYRLDPEGKEKVFKPETTVAQKFGDCKKMTVLIACALKQAGIEPLIKHVFYKDENFTHVYVIVPYPDANNYIIIDPVNDKKWNQEVIYERANVYDLKGNKMDLFTGNKPSKNFSSVNFRDNVNYAAGSIDRDLSLTMGCNVMGAADRNALIDEYFEMSGVGRKKLKDKLKEIKDKAKEVAAKLGFAPIRAASLAIIRLNPKHVANKIAEAATINRAKIEGVWSRFGGKPDELFKVVLAGSGVAPVQGYVTGSLAAIAASLALAAPVFIPLIAQVKELFKSKGKNADLDDLEDTAATSLVNSPIDSVVTTVTTTPRGDDSGGDDPTKPTLGGFDVTACLKGSPAEVAANLFKFGFIYFPAACYSIVTAPYFFIPLIVIGFADMTGLIKFHKKKS